MTHTVDKHKMKIAMFVGVALLITSPMLANAQTNNKIGKLDYRIVSQPPTPSYPHYSKSQPYHGYSNYGYPQNYGRLPSRPAHPPHYGYPQQPYPVYPQQNGLTIIYNQQLPSYTEYHSETRGFVNGNGQIQSSSYTIISDWRRYNLPAPAVGMHWIYENGRYLQVRSK